MHTTRLIAPWVRPVATLLHLAFSDFATSARNASLRSHTWHSLSSLAVGRLPGKNAYTSSPQLGQSPFMATVCPSRSRPNRSHPPLARKTPRSPINGGRKFPCGPSMPEPETAPMPEHITSPKSNATIAIPMDISTSYVPASAFICSTSQFASEYTRMSRRLHRGYLTAASLPRYRSLRSMMSNMASSTTGCPLKYVFLACA